MLTDAGVVAVFLQRHVAHHAHGAEYFRRILGGFHHDLGGEHLRDGLQRQVGQAAVGDGLRMIGGPGRLPDGGARDLQPDRDLGQFGGDRLMLDEWAAALHAQMGVVERGFIRGAAMPRLSACASGLPRPAASSPSRFPAGTRQSLNATSPHAPCSQALSCARTLTPGAFAGTSRTLALARPGIFTSTANSPATGALATQSLTPLTIQSPPNFTALVFTAAAADAGR